MAKLSLKLLVDKKVNKVIFAEASKDFVDFLFAILALPAGTIMKILDDRSLLGCVGNVYKSLQNWNTSYFQDGQDKDTLFRSHAPTDVNVTGLLLPCIEQLITSRKLYRCGCCSSRSSRSYVTYIYNTRCPGCSNHMNNEVTLAEDRDTNVPDTNPTSSSGNGEKGLVKNLVTYMVTDDLSVTPLSMITLVSQLAKFNLASLDSLETMTVDLGIDEAVGLLKAALKSDSALTNMFLAK